MQSLNLKFNTVSHTSFFLKKVGGGGASQKEYDFELVMWTFRSKGLTLKNRLAHILYIIEWMQKYASLYYWRNWITSGVTVFFIAIKSVKIVKTEIISEKSQNKLILDH